MRAFNTAARTVGPILLQFPLYGGIMGMMTGTGLAAVIAQAFVAFSTHDTLPFWTFVSSNIISLFVPSGGGHWAVQGPFMIPAAVNLNVDPALTAMATAMGEQTANMIQPFWRCRSCHRAPRHQGHHGLLRDGAVVGPPFTAALLIFARSWSMAGLVNRRSLKIEWGQCDPAGIVFYPQFLIIFDTSTGLLFERTGLSASVMRKKYTIIGMPLVEQGTKFLRPCRFDDEIVVESEVEEWGRTSFTVRHRILNQGKLAVDGFEKRVWAILDPDQPGRSSPYRSPPKSLQSFRPEQRMISFNFRPHRGRWSGEGGFQTGAMTLPLR